MPGFCDLNLNVSNLQPKSIDQLVEYAIKLGYDNLGLAIDYEFPIPDATNRSKNKADRFKISIPQPKTYTVPNSLAARLKNSGRNIKIYNRINIRIKPSDINTHLQHLKGKSIQDYDLISLEPINNQVLMYLCTNNYMADIITINSGIECGLTDKHLIRLIRNAMNVFSVVFEMNYSSSLSSSTERRDFIMLGRCLSFNTKSKALMVNSGTSQTLNMRAPYDLLNLVKIFDLPEERAHRIVRDSPQKVIMNSFCRKHTNTGMVYFNDLTDLKKLEEVLLVKRSKLNEDSSKNNGQTEVESPKKKLKTQ